MGVAILSTRRGCSRTASPARPELGGEVLCYVWYATGEVAPGEDGTMSRIGKKPITIPKGVQVGIQGQQVEVKGPKGRLELRVHDLCSVKIADGSVTVGRGAEHRTARALHGLTRALVANMVQGVTEGFERKLEIQGIGYRVRARGADISRSPWATRIRSCLPCPTA